MVEVDEAAETIRWRGVEVRVPGLGGAMRDPDSGLIVALSHAGAGRLVVFDEAGAQVGLVAAPAGYRLSHLVRQPHLLAVVGQGEAAVDGWPDWHFDIDARSARVQRAAPAY